MPSLAASHYIAELCESCAQDIYGSKPPKPHYARAVADLLLGTIYHESAGFQYTRQHGFSWESDQGAWGIAQCELGSVTDSLHYLKRRRDVALQAARWLANDKDATPDWLLQLEPRQVIRLLPISPALSVLFCRVHYLRRPESIPLEVSAQDAFYKQFYNTRFGAAKPGDFTKALKNAKERLEI